MNSPSIILAAMSKAGYFLGWLPDANARANRGKIMDRTDGGSDRGRPESPVGSTEDAAEAGDDQH